MPPKRTTVVTASCLLALLLTTVLVATLLLAKSTGNRHGLIHTIVYGDSLLVQSKPYLLEELHQSVIVRAYAGDAPCDWLPALQKDLTTLHPTLVLLESAGNSLSQCMAPYPAPGSPAWTIQYEADIGAFLRLATAAGARAVFVAPPPSLGMTVAEEPVLGVAEQEVALHSGTALSTAPALAVTAGGAFAWTLPCLQTEYEKPECVRGRISVRAPDGDHFCFCTLTYSSGAFRYGSAIAAVVRSQRLLRLPLLPPSSVN